MSKVNYDLQNIEQQLKVILELLRNLNTEFQPKILYTQKELVDLLGISPNTLKKWERYGLPRLEPPFENTRNVFYKLDDVISFLSID